MESPVAEGAFDKTMDNKTISNPWKTHTGLPAFAKGFHRHSVSYGGQDSGHSKKHKKKHKKSAPRAGRFRIS